MAFLLPPLVIGIPVEVERGPSLSGFVAASKYFGTKDEQFGDLRLTWFYHFIRLTSATLVLMGDDEGRIPGTNRAEVTRDILVREYAADPTRIVFCRYDSKKHSLSYAIHWYAQQARISSEECCVLSDFSDLERRNLDASIRRIPAEAILLASYPVGSVDWHSEKVALRQAYGETIATDKMMSTISAAAIELRGIKKS